jgi:hypothetical protein
MSAFRNVNVPSGGSFRINNIPLPSINDTSTGLTDVLSASKVYSLVINSVAEYSGYQISQNNVLSSAYTVYATKQGKLITLTFPNINTTLNATDDIISFVMPNSLHAVSEMIETCYVNDQPCKFTLTPTLMGWYIRILKNPISNFIVGLNNIKTFTISYLGLNDTLLTDSVWGTALPDFVSPTVTLSIASGGLMSAIGDTRTINIVFSEPVIDFIESDITLTGLTLSAYTFGSTTASFTATSTAQLCSVIINAGVCRDAAFNLNTVSNNLDVKTIITYNLLATPHSLASTVVSSACSVDGTIVIVGGSIANIKLSSNSGSTWANVSSALSYVNNIYMSDNGQYILLTGPGYSYSTNYGVSFTLIQSNGHAIGINSSGNIFITGIDFTPAAKLQISISGSVSTLTASPVAKWKAICVSDSGTVIVAIAANYDSSYPGWVFVSQNSGGSWFNPPGMTISRALLNTYCSADGSEIIIYENGASGDVWQSSDSGSTFTQKGITGSWLNGNISSDGVTRVGTLSSNIKISDDSGATWVDGVYAPNPTSGTWKSSTISSDGTKAYMFYSNGDTFTN